jgi:hypothetical protein
MALLGPCKRQGGIAHGKKEHSMTEPITQQLDAKTLAEKTPLGYGLSMADFLEYVRHRRAQIRKELQDLETAEKIYREAHGDEAVDLPTRAVRQPQLAFNAVTEAAKRFARKPKTIQEMVMQLLAEVHPEGLSALEILDQIQRRWKPDLMRTSLSPQLSRLQPDIRNVNRKWYLEPVSESGASEVSNAPA